MARRNTTGYSFVIGVDKPAGMSSHDVVGRARRIYGERRIGHTGTLDPAATGALAICVGPAARLDRFMAGHDKTYEFTCVFGISTSTDDAEGEIICELPVAQQLFDKAYAQEKVVSLVGHFKQIPPVYSAIKVNGKRAYAQARAGNVIQLDPRDVDVYDAQLVAVEQIDEHPVWRIKVHVSSGTYVRALARDLGHSLGTCAHVGQLRRLSAGLLDVRECVSLEDLEAYPFASLLDPVRLLGFRFTYCRNTLVDAVACGRAIPANEVTLYAYDRRHGFSIDAACSCTSGVQRSEQTLVQGERICMVVDNTLAAIYAYDAQRDCLASVCGFSIGVKRGADI